MILSLGAGYVYGTVNENGTLNLSAPANATITSVSFASYGTQTVLMETTQLVVVMQRTVKRL